MPLAHPSVARRVGRGRARLRGSISFL